MASVAAVLVTHEPDLAVLRQSLATLAPRARRVVVYDNSETAAAVEGVRSACRELGAACLGGAGNLGIGAAQNAAVASLAGDEVECVLFLDQDSRVPPGLVEELHGSFRRLRALDPRAGILGALPVGEDGRPYRTRVLGRLGPYLRVGFAISSGSILRLDELRDAGGLREDLFIDLVDCELSWRMARQGRASYLDPAIPFRHGVGTGRRVAALGREAPVSSPHRNYYQVRNVLLLGRSGVLSRGAACRSLCKALGVVLLSGLAGDRPLERLRFAALGLRHGLRGRGGRLPAPAARGPRGG
jgi:rhamnosyltransferase